MQPDHPRRVRVEPVSAGDVEFFVELADEGGPETVGTGRLLSFDGVRDTVQAVAGELAQVWEQVKPAEATVEFGLSLTAKGGPLTGLIVAGDGSATLKITLVWKGGS
ncbi:CU044_2847 family protein [Micromonospora yasonensis]|uniref:CU044_2847 family protein n=1 Tax=Micromonospora yasonensis TaxID=1128667 RepID=UPI00222FA214|nr:CU044_2847 family protein [Micromonospora yasonensis]MCW3840026.1 CU044_2847 family protein [Micromonospora yasonensis]